jgi:hypothetical protein
MFRIFFLPYLGNRSKSDPCSYELFCLQSHILSFPKVLQIPPESPCIYTIHRLAWLFLVSAAIQMRSALFWDIRQPTVSTFRDTPSAPFSRLKKSKNSWPLKMGPRGCTETSIWNYHSTMRDVPGVSMNGYVKMIHFRTTILFQYQTFPIKKK